MANESDPTALYLDLLKKALAFALWDERWEPVQPRRYRVISPRRYIFGLLDFAARCVGLRLVKPSARTSEDVEQGQYWPQQADTMIGLKRLDNIQLCVETVLDQGVPGDLIETGVWRGGACILMRGILAARGVTDRRVYLADSFAGLPEPDGTRYPRDADDRHHTYGELAVSQEEVERNFARYGLLDDQVVMLKGWFKDTLPTAPVERLAVLRLDGDMYQSTIEALTHLYPKLSSGGYCIIDDYGHGPCRAAVDEYRAEHGITGEIVQIDWTGAYWRKP